MLTREANLEEAKGLCILLVRAAALNNEELTVTRIRHRALILEVTSTDSLTMTLPSGSSELLGCSRFLRTTYFWNIRAAICKAGSIVAAALSPQTKKQKLVTYVTS